MRNLRQRRKLVAILAAATMAGGAGLIFGGDHTPAGTAHWHFMVVAPPGNSPLISVDASV
jgi:hypothetical protein